MPDHCIGGTTLSIGRPEALAPLGMVIDTAIVGMVLTGVGTLSLTLKP
ncbi:hypothetical protein JCM19236_985 [Vibrio sp. JCM 19236]|nr:hypothetical protein JCM19236_985 [Vibrio sp. JCM 19236]